MGELKAISATSFVFLQQAVFWAEIFSICKEAPNIVKWNTNINQERCFTMNNGREYQEKKRVLFFGLPWTFTDYTIGQEILTIHTGFLKKEENYCYMYKIQDVKLTSTLAERIFGLSTITCYTGDVTHPQLSLSHIKHAREIKDFILEAAEEARQKRRIMNTLDIGTGDA